MGDLGVTPAHYAARPTISIDGDRHLDLAENLSALLVEETTVGLFRCEMTVSNWGSGDREPDFLYLDRSLIDFGKSVSVEAGSGRARGVVFDGRITGIEAHYPADRPPELTVLAEDRFQDLRMTRRTRTFEDVTDRDVVERIANAHSLRTDLDLEGPTYRVLAQLNQSDLAFIRDRARSVDATVKVEGDTLVAKKQGGGNGGDEITLTYLEGLIEFSVLADLARQRTALTVAGWDVSAKEEVAHEATVSAIQSELNGFDSGADLLEQAFGTRVERIVHAAPGNQEQARYLAESEFRRVSRTFVQGAGTAEGDARIKVGARVTLRGLGDLFEGRYSVTAVEHTFDLVSGFRTRFHVERPGIQRV